MRLICVPNLTIFIFTIFTLSHITFAQDSVDQANLQNIDDTSLFRGVENTMDEEGDDADRILKSLQDTSADDFLEDDDQEEEVIHHSSSKDIKQRIQPDEDNMNNEKTTNTNNNNNDIPIDTIPWHKSDPLEKAVIDDDKFYQEGNMNYGNEYSSSIIEFKLWHGMSVLLILAIIYKWVNKSKSNHILDNNNSSLSWSNRDEKDYLPVITQ
ncbi:hypothetical protein INT48_004605 [Thamnidium elegans]|uniref:Uncharacterized protein n=1 Tax=Thamnidium elegans TaxID=101142 RepID=A0A8H7SU79_9FUNG|nr:hypothetical protein INT48_004605 [Thamnidium elegans]